MSNLISRDIWEQIQRLIKKDSTISNREIARKLNISRDSAAKWRNKTIFEPVSVSTPVESVLSERIHSWLMRHKKTVTIDDISNHFDISIGRARAAVKELQDAKKSISVSDDAKISHEPDLQPSEPTRIDIRKFKGKTIRFGLTSDEHLGSKYHRDDVLNALFDIWESQGITDVYECGNMIDGEARFNKHDLLVHGMQNQVDFFVQNWPKRDGIKTHFITGDDHEGWYVQREGVNIGEFIQMCAEKAGRTDLEFLGHMEHDIIITAKQGEARLRLVHAGGGSAYATSYSVQKIVESLTGGTKPSVMLVGHYHKAEYSYVRNVHVVQAGTSEDQTPFMRKLKLQAHVGGWTVSFTVDDYGNVHEFTPQFHPFYDREYYEKNWEYLWKPGKKHDR